MREQFILIMLIGFHQFHVNFDSIIILMDFGEFCSTSLHFIIDRSNVIPLLELMSFFKISR